MAGSSLFVYDHYQKPTTGMWLRIRMMIKKSNMHNDDTLFISMAFAKLAFFLSRNTLMNQYEKNDSTGSNVMIKIANWPALS